ncbi:MAG: ATP-binding protein, partial [Candidatus Thorarchaeota archaeon]|nr:ATP-binding protein [Candidatus Thorarchaeota archaeon]
MYERFEPSERIFVGREEYIQWMEEALERCREQSVVLHLRGIGGIGKSSLLDYWKRNITETIPLDCQQHNDFYSKLNALAKGAVMLGVKLPRFDVLWQIRQRFVEGVEPVRQEGREWAREVVMAIPFVGSLASIGSAISAVGAKVTPKLKQKYGALGEWLQTRVGKDYVQRLLEILWKEPRTAEFLYLDALAEDLNNRKTSQKPILFRLDHVEQVDNEQLRWRYSGREVSETELWLVFLSLLHNAVGVTASRRAIPRKISEELKVEESELAELDINSSNALLEKRKITDSSLQEKIAAVSGGNPFVIGALCDLADSEGLSPDDVEVLRGNTLEAVRLKTWRKMFSEAKDLQSLVEKAGILPFFNRRTLGIIAPDMRTDHWDRLTHLSFVRNREDGNWVLHDLARQLIVAELGHKLKEVTDSAVAKLESAAKDEADDSLLGLAVSIRALESEVDAINLLDDYASLFMWQGQPSRVPVLLNTVRITTIAGRMIVLVYEAWALAGINRVADAEHHFKEAAQLLRAHGEQMQGDIFLMCVGSLHSLFGWFLERTDHSLEAEKTLQEGIRAILDYSGDKSINWYGGITSLYMNQGLVLLSMQRLKEADDAFRQSIKLNHEMTSVVDYSAPDGVNWGERTLSWMLAMYGITQLKLGHLGEARMRINEALEYCIDPFSRIIALGNLGEILRLTDMFEDAERVIREGAKLCEETYGQNPELHFFPIAIF